MTKLNTITKTHIRSYAQVDAYLKTTKGRWVASRKVANNTYLHRIKGGIGLLFHKTYVLVWHPNNTVTLNTGGWTTMTTKARMNAWLPITPYGSSARFCEVSSVGGYWSVFFTRSDHHWNSRKPFDDPQHAVWFHDGMVLDLKTCTEFSAARPMDAIFAHNERVEKLLTRWLNRAPKEYEIEDPYKPLLDGGPVWHGNAAVEDDENLDWSAYAMACMEDGRYPYGLVYRACMVAKDDNENWTVHLYESIFRDRSNHYEIDPVTSKAVLKVQHHVVNKKELARVMRKFIRSTCLQGAHAKGARLQ